MKYIQDIPVEHIKFRLILPVLDENGDVSELPLFSYTDLHDIICAAIGRTRQQAVEEPNYFDSNAADNVMEDIVRARWPCPE
jgi:hypothetical protein